MLQGKRNAYPLIKVTRNGGSSTQKRFFKLLSNKNYTCDLNTDDENDITNCMYLNNAPAYFDAGLVKLNNYGEFHLMSTRNNAFTNRGQKATLTVGVNSVVAVGGLAVGASFIGLIGLAAFCMCCSNYWNC